MSLIKNHWSPITYCYLVCFINLRQELNKHIIYLMTMFESSVCQFGITEVRGHSKHCPGKKKKGSLLRYPSYVLLDILEENIKGERGVISCWGENDKKWRQQCVLLSLSMFCLFCEGSVMRLNRCLLMDHRMPLVPSCSSSSSSSSSSIIIIPLVLLCPPAPPASLLCPPAPPPPPPPPPAYHLYQAREGEERRGEERRGGERRGVEGRGDEGRGVERRGGRRGERGELRVT